MKTKLISAVFLFVGLIILANFVQAPKPWRGFIIGLPDQVDAAPGDSLTINGTVLNIGYYWLHDFNISVQGLPAGYNVTAFPNWFQDLRILRAWTPEKGLYIVPENFSIHIDVPADSAGIFLVNVTGKEWMSWRQTENSSTFILRVSSPTKLSVSDIVVPENVTESQPFNISFSVRNEGTVDQLTKVSVIAPEGWVVEPNEQSFTVKVGSSEQIIFTLTPTNASGQISVYMEYPFKSQILNITKTGPFLIPQPSAAETTVPGIEVELPTALVTAVDFIKSNPIITIIAIILLIIIFWNVWQIVRHYGAKEKRKKPEEMKKQLKLPTGEDLAKEGQKLSSDAIEEIAKKF